MKKKKHPPGRPMSTRTRNHLEKILLAKRIKSWKSDLDGCLRFLEGIPFVESIHGRKWVVRMIEYYGGKAHELLRKPPKGCHRVVPHYSKRLAEIEGRLDDFRD